MEYDNIVALDLGTTKFCIAVVQNQGSDIAPRLKIISVPARGMRKGMLADFTEAQEALSALLDLAEQELSIFITKVCVGVAGSHLKSNIVEHKTSLASESPINHEVLDEIENHLRLSHGCKLSNVIYTQALAYKLDGREWIDNPIGFSGNDLLSKHFIIRADRNYLNDIIRLCGNCGVEVSRVFAEPLASSSVLVTQHKLVGVVADIGGGTTDGIVSTPQTSKLFATNVGGNLIANDLVLGLNSINAGENQRTSMSSSQIDLRR